MLLNTCSSEWRTGHVWTRPLGNSDSGGLCHTCDKPLPEKLWLPSVFLSAEDVLGPSGQGTVIPPPLFAAMLDEVPMFLSDFTRVLFEVLRL